MENPIQNQSETQRIKMPAEMFRKLWSSPYSANGTQWANVVKFGVEDHPSGEYQITFTGVVVTGEVEIKHSKVGNLEYDHLVLSNCQLPNCIFKDSSFRSVAITENSVVGDVKIENATIGDFHINGNSKMGNFLLQNNTTAKDFIIENATIGNIEILSSVTGRFRIENSIAADFFILSGSTTGSFDIVNSVTRDFFIRRESNARSFWFENSMARLFRIENSKVLVLSFKSKSKISKVRVWHSEIQRIQVKTNSFIGLLRCNFNLTGPVHLLFSQSSFGDLDFDSSVFSEFSTMTLSDCSTNRVSINNFCNYGSIFFSNLTPMESWEDFKKDENNLPVFTDGKAQFETVTRASTLRFSDSDLGKLQLINCDLRKFKRFEFSDTKMMDVFVAGSQMPGEETFCLPNNGTDPTQIVRQKRLAYGQIKKIFEARGDIVTSLNYLVFEMEAYRKRLQMRGVLKHRGELVMLWMNKLSTNYGVSWQRGLLATFISMIFFYSIFCYLIGYRFEHNSPDDVERFWELVSYAPYYLNPLRDLDSVSLVKEEDFTPIARIWDFISRIFVAYFVYQTIQAFRKLGKSSG